MKYKVIFGQGILKAQFTKTLGRSLFLADPLKVGTVKDLLKAIHNNFAFAFDSAVDPSGLFITTEDEFLLPPNAPVKDALEENQIIKIMGVQ